MLVSNLWAIGQQYVTNRLIGRRRSSPRGPPAERRVKQAGGSPRRVARVPRTPHGFPVMTDPITTESRLTAFVQDLIERMRLELQVSLESLPDGLRVNLSGPTPNRSFAGRARRSTRCQHVVSAAFRDALPDNQRIVVDCQGFRKAKDRELQQMARYLMEK